MSGFVARVLPEVAPVAEPIIPGDGFLPSVDPADLREAQRIAEDVKPARLREAVIGAMLSVALDLGAWADAHRAAGVAALADVPGPTNRPIAGEPRLLVLYRRAIGALVKAELTERSREDAVPGPGQRRADELDPAIGELRRVATHAIRDMVGTTRTAVELI